MVVNPKQLANKKRSLGSQKWGFKKTKIEQLNNNIVLTVAKTQRQIINIGPNMPDGLAGVETAF